MNSTSRGADVGALGAHPSQADIPPPTAVSVLLRVAISAHLETVGKKRATAFLRSMSRTLASEAALSSIVPIRGAKQQAEANMARQEAIALFQALLPVFVAKLDDLD